jgi:uncharacterized membrane protein
MTVLLGFAALAVDVGALFRAKRNLQIAADAAATGGALDYKYHDSVSSAQTAGKAASGQNGYTDSSGGVTVTVNIPPASGPNTASNYVEAIVSAPNPTYFMKLFNTSSVTVSARAVAGTPAAPDTCIWLLAPSGNAFQLQGNYDIEAPNCGIQVDSTSTNAIGVTGNGGTVNAKFLNIAGSATLQHTTTPTAPTMNAPSRNPPQQGLTGPTAANNWSGCGTQSSATTLTGTIAGPGFSSVTCYTNSVTISNATLGEGLYVFEKDVTLSGTVTVNGGVLDLAGTTSTFNQSNGALSLTGPTDVTSQYWGIGIMQPVSSQELDIQFGSSTETLNAMIYAPNAPVYLQDHGGNVTASGIIASSLIDKTSVITIPNYYTVHAATSPYNVVTLVE